MLHVPKSPIMNRLNQTEFENNRLSQTESAVFQKDLLSDYLGPLSLCKRFLKHFKEYQYRIIEPPHVKTNKEACAPSEDSDQPGHPPSLIRVFAVRIKKAWVLSYPLSARRRF